MTASFALTIKESFKQGIYMYWIKCFIKISCIFPDIFGTIKCFTQIFQNLWTYPPVNFVDFFLHFSNRNLLFRDFGKKIQTNQINPIIIVKRCKNCLLFIHPICVCLSTLEMSKCQKPLKRYNRKQTKNLGCLNGTPFGVKTNTVD